jgi:hypothetical protein
MVDAWKRIRKSTEGEAFLKEFLLSVEYRLYLLENIGKALCLPQREKKDQDRGKGARVG